MVFSAVSEKAFSLFHHFYNSWSWKAHSGADSKAPLWVDFNRQFTSEGIADIVMYFCPLINTVVHSKGFKAVESSSR